MSLQPQGRMWLLLAWVLLVPIKPLARFQLCLGADAAEAALWPGTLQSPHMYILGMSMQRVWLAAECLGRLVAGLQVLVFGSSR